MSSGEIINDYDSFLSSVVLNKPFSSKGGIGGKTVTIRTVGDKIPWLKMLKMKVPFGASNYNGKWTVDMSIVDTDFLNFIEKLDNLIKNRAINDSEEWFGSKKSIEMVDYSSILRRSKNNTYAPTVRGTVIMEDMGKVLGTKLFDCNRELQDSSKFQEYVSKGAICSGLLSLSSIWIIGNRFGVTLRFVQLKREEPLNSTSTSKVLNDYAFVDDSDESDSDE